MIQSVITVQVRIFPRPNHTLPTPANILETLYDAQANSYRVPIHVREVHPVLDIQYGAAQYPTGVERLWERYKQVMHAIWVRYHHDEHDRIFWVTSRGKSQDRLCRYMFDHMRITWRTADDQPHQNSFDWVTQGNVWALNNVEGSYLAANCRAEFCHPTDGLRPGIRTLTTPACLMSNGLNWHYYKITPPTLAAFAALNKERIEKAAFYYQRQLVRADIQHPDDDAWGWTFFSLDGWDNCADPYYRKYSTYYFYGVRPNP